MKKLSVLLVAISIIACQPEKKEVKKEDKSAEKVSFKTTEDSLSYAVGGAIAENVKQNGMSELNLDLIVEGLRDNLDTAAKIKLTKKQSNAVIGAYYAKKKADQQKKVEADRIAGQQFLENNKTKEGVTTTASGLQYEVIKKGNGAKPKAEQNVTVHYHGTLIDGTVFDSSVERGQPTSFKLNEVIPGWTEGVQLMSVGAKYKFYIPFQLGYGPRGAGERIPPFSTLVFEVELISIDKK